MGAVVELRPDRDPSHGSEPTVRKINMEDGHTRISHGLIEELAQSKYKLSGREYMVLLVVMRKTYGYHKTSDWIALSQFEDDTGIAKLDCRKVIKGLVERRLLIRKASGNDQRLSINTVVSEWLCERPSIKTETKKRNDRKPVQADPPLNQNSPPSKEVNPPSKEVNPPSTVKKKATKPAKTQKFTAPDREFAEYMMKRIEAANELDLSKKTNLDKWADIIRLMREQDKHTDKEIGELFHFANNHPVQYSNGRPFSWSWVIRSPEKLRQKWDELTIQNRIAGIQHGNSHNGENGQQHNGRSGALNDHGWLDE